MKTLNLIFLILTFATVNVVAQITPDDWEKVIITKNTDDVKGMERVDRVSAQTSILYGGQKKLREKTTIKIKQEAAKIGASIVLIEVDDFANTPINNVNMVGTAYVEGEVQDKQEEIENHLEAVKIGPDDWEKVIITKNTDDVEGLKRVDRVSAQTSILYGGQKKLREKTTIKIKQEAAKIGASIVLIEVDDFAMTPINNVNMVGTAYVFE